MNKEDIINNLFANQIKNIDSKYCLNSKDIIRFASYISSDPFSETECCKWKGAISKSSHQSKYINFWFNKKKQALHRILYLNYKGELPKNKYLRFSCPNQCMKGICCNINHLELINKEEDIDSDTELKNQQIKKVTKKTKKAIKESELENDGIDIKSFPNKLNKNIFVIVFDDE
jgi:hypothetical protein